MKVTNSERSRRSRECDQIFEAVACPDECKANVTTTQLVHDDVCQLQHQIDAILRSHHADVRNQIRLVSLQARFRGGGPMESGRVGPGADHCDVRGVDAVAPQNDLSIGVVGGDHVIRRPDRAPLHKPQGSVDEPIAVREPRLVQLGAKIVVIKDERGSVKHPEQEPDGPEDVRWIAALDDVKRPRRLALRLSARVAKKEYRYSRMKDDLIHPGHKVGTCRARLR